ncbi:glycoside hydrolase family 13 protein [Leptolyngbya iicbica]|uniref:Glycoside hydrolase family 13 protein n=2 Tax=Cyanophyceae TaxID=3028117 RepID=A0A4Q7EFM5_9CYAN|nr:glycoside hydrolase family 13 protein [Leptolyngbya sp. LK]RZM81728.1 glycoside hydrolase family 13 protein [Leptolyngbya sp. LK]
MTIRTPEWVKHAVFYQIFPDRFARSQPPHHCPEMAVTLEPWDTAPTLAGYKGGNFWGIIDKLDYLQSLGINAIYLTPIFQSTCNHRYHTHDYYRVDPLLGGNEAFAEFLAAAHDRHIRVVLDGVFNHASRGFFFFNDILENGPHSPWLDWFKVERWPLSAYDGRLPANYVSWVNNRALPQFNHDNPAVREYIMQIGEYWIRQGIDGWRLDVPFEVKTPGFWEEFRDRIKAINPEAYIVGEVWKPAAEWLDGKTFDAVMNYVFAGPTMAFAAGDRVVLKHAEIPDYYPYPALDAAGYQAKIEELLDLYDWEIHQVQLNLISSHDIARALTVMGDDVASMQLAVLLQMTFPGAPCIYYGDEVGLRGSLDPDCRWAFPAEEKWDTDLLKHHQALIQLRHQHPALRTGAYHPLMADGLLYGFVRQHSQEVLVVLVNSGEGDRTIDLSQVAPGLGDRWQVLYGPLTVESKTEETQSVITVPSRSGGILTRLEPAA